MADTNPADDGEGEITLKPKTSKKNGEILLGISPKWSQHSSLHCFSVVFLRLLGFVTHTHTHPCQGCTPFAMSSFLNCWGRCHWHFEDNLGSWWLCLGAGRRLVREFFVLKIHIAVVSHQLVFLKISTPKKTPGRFSWEVSPKTFQGMMSFFWSNQGCEGYLFLWPAVLPSPL